MIKKEDCKDCIWFDVKDKKPYCEVDKTYLKADLQGKIKPPSSCHYSIDWRK